MEQEIIDQIKGVKDVIKGAIDRVCAPGFRQTNTAAVLLSAASVANHELDKLLEKIS